MHRPAQCLSRTAAAARLLTSDSRIPRPLRGLVLLGLLPIPGPFDEALLLLAAVPLVLFYRRLLEEAWREASASPTPPARDHPAMRGIPTKRP